MKKHVFFLLTACLCVLLSVSAAAESVSLTAVVPDEHTVSITIGEHGSVRVDGHTYSGTANIPVQRFGTAEISIVPEVGYKLDGLTASSAEYLTYSETSLTVSGIAEDVFIELSFGVAVIHWGDTSYEWSDDYHTVTAACAAVNDPRIVKTETAETTETVFREPTCARMGVTLYTAEFEDPLFTAQTKRLENIPMIPHTEVTDPAVPASCETDGLTGGSHCAVCGQVIEAQQTVPALGHDWGEPEYTWNGSNTKVTAVRICARDSSHQEQETVDAAAEITKAPTCLEMGETTYTGAAFENPAFAAQTRTIANLPLGDHSPVTDPAVPGTCVSEGLSEGSHCAVCGIVLTAQVSTGLGHHVYTLDPAVPASCEEDGLKEGLYCEACGEVFVAQEAVPALGHDWHAPVYTWSEDHASVTASRTCGRDPAHTETETVPAEAEVVQEPTCTEAGFVTYTGAAFENSAFEAQSLPMNELPALGHDWASPTYSWSADYAAVTARRVCRHDAAHIETETVGTTAKVTTQPTCTGKGKTTYTSAAFENPAFKVRKKTVTNIAALGHTPETDPAVPATCAAEGLTEGSHCAVCGEVLVPQETIAKTSHQYVVDPGVAAGCETEGLTSGFHCGLCGEVFVAQAPVHALGHAWGEAAYTWGDGNTSVTASAVCTRDPAHTANETVAAHQAVTLSPTEDQAGLLSWVTDAFASGAFTVQTKPIAPIPALGTLQVLRLPAALTAIDEEAFAGGAFEAVILPASCTSVGSRAFAGCANLLYVKVPAGAVIAPDAFDGCPNVIIDRSTE